MTILDVEWRQGRYWQIHRRRWCGRKERAAQHPNREARKARQRAWRRQARLRFFDASLYLVSQSIGAAHHILEWKGRS